MEVLNNINNTFDSYQQIINLYEKYKNKSFEIVDISIQDWFAANMCSPLGAIFEKFQINLNQICFKDLDKKIEIILEKNDFLSYYGYKKINDTFNTTIRFLKLNPTDGKYFKEYIFDELLGRTEMPNMSKSARNAIAEGIYEVFVNAQMHSQTKSIFTCGQFFPNKNKIEFTVTDIGIGFKNNINNSFERNLSATQAIQWAVKEGKTTKKDTPGGIGLAKLIEFINVSKGKLQIVSNEGFYEFSNGNEKTMLFNGEFPGSIVNMQFITNDPNYYVLKEEIDLTKIF